MTYLNIKQKYILFFLLVGIFIVSLSYSFYFKIPPLVDARAYDTIAWHLATGEGYREALDVPINQDNAIIRVGPGYEFFLAGIYYLFGHFIQIIWIIQALLLTASSFLIFLISQEVFKERWNYKIGFISALFIGLSPDLITMQAMLMTETLGIFLAIITIYLFFRYYNSKKKSLFLASILGVSFGISVLVRTPLALLVIPFGVYFLYEKKWKHLVLFTVFSCLIFVPWTIRNWNVYHAFIPTNAASGFNFLVGNHKGANGEQEPYPILDEYVKQFGHIEANKKATSDALNFITTQPLEFLKLTFLRTSIYFSFARPTGFWFHLHGINKAVTLVTSALYATTIFIFGLWGILAIRSLTHEEKKKAFYLLAMLIMMPLALVGVVVETRYRFLVYPFFALFAGFGFNAFSQEKLSLKYTLILTGLLVLNTAFDIVRNFSRITERIHGL